MSSPLLCVLWDRDGTKREKKSPSSKPGRVDAFLQKNFDQKKKKKETLLTNSKMNVAVLK